MLDSKSPVFMVLMPVFNRMNLLERAIGSLYRQTFQDFCLVVIDDGSNDNSLQRAMDLTKKLAHPSVLIRLPENIGVGTALNIGAEVSRSKSVPWITRLDSDDVYASDYLENRLRVIRTYPEVDLFHGGIRVINGPETVPDARNRKRRIAISETSQGATIVVKAEVFERLGCFDDLRYGEDHAFLEKARMAGRSIRKLDFGDYYYYRDTLNALTG
ncbi:glycosyltransferase family 2 protein [Acidithiobacillus sp. 'AMD consortium']|jgi:glycosyltransferase involved in cell wall biosynthesis|uniref:Glycosyltransferase family 2 protein n=2 Tax=Acidithiobacillus ferridurans TaxID=1232575 RepID=A0A8X8GCG1_ACIFI|nr:MULTISPECIES: glycosyltransferase family A protein [Acidithiobacillus]MBU2714898.1 glycosyltransferase family 2 protein [Acidithiobacillus ferridurans]MBU2719776.1 glycosyltransferase family 2 protein [Acidithiobacillus ferridurans]MBU2723724.1 glycosyltransferase family 2 protein [Acidithiobacillus ferridurans]MBU2727431.1 glycosyltransferase family 2 protein [Acidithiobacillus ferridurans]MBU2803602.1 glycosyltransferase family 2 protein [Acidithiobacillus ferridurans]